MAYSTSFGSLVITICLLYSLTQLSAHTLQNPVNLGLLKDEETQARNYFADFLRVLYAPQAPKDDVSLSAGSSNDMPNEIFPMISSDEDDHEEENYDKIRRKEFPVDGVLLPILQKRNARYCGSYLADALRMACSKSSYLPLFGKRSTLPGKSLGLTTTAATPNAELGSWPFINDDKAHSILSNHHLFHRYTRGVHDECCVKGCTFKELTSYCTRPN
ncbi:Insulin/IGF/relaxin-like peptide 2 [Daphnia pulex]|uniref:Insulin/IGF/relaxin-like peptide 2 n=1 Tax=Daphnia pulex TaxID=6669 RepID=E9HE21_DAPPU|nr:Insulin/IGF/relaxin-like peptide 2 [Daphnia pulex]|eukprot:EFX70023.1 Insulin/IGF/relaxin-like peptide 2 [Daphnia pulex]